MKASRPLWILLFIGSFFLILWPRIVHLDADPPVSLSQAFQNVGVFLYDEGWWTANARNKVLFGEWTFGTYNLMYVSPVFTLLVWISFSLFGVCLITARLPSLVMGLISLGLFFCLARRSLGPRWGSMATLLMGLSYPLTIYHRVALLEPTATFFTLLAGFFWFQEKPTWGILSGICTGLALMTKLSLAFLPLVFLLLGILKGGQQKKRLGWFAAGFLLASGIWFYAFFLPHRFEVLASYAHYNQGRWVPGASGVLTSGLNIVKVLCQSLILGTVYRHEAFAKMPLLFLFSWVGALVLLYRRKSTDLSSFFLFYAGIGGGFLGLSSYQPMRYYSLLIPAMAYLTAEWGRSAWIMTEEGRFSRWLYGVGWIGLAVVICQILYALGLPVIRKYVGSLGLMENDPFSHSPFSLSAAMWQAFSQRSLGILKTLNHQQAWMTLQTLAAAVTLCFGVFLSSLLVLSFRSALRTLFLFLMKPSIVIILIVLGLGFDLFQIWAWALHPKYTIRDFSRRLEQILPPESIVSPGGTYSLENRLQYDNSELGSGRVVKYEPPVSAVVILDGHPLLGKGMLQNILRQHQNAFLVKRTTVLDGQYHLSVFKLEGDSL